MNNSCLHRITILVYHCSNKTMLDDSFFFSGLCFCKHLHFKLNSILHVANCVLPPNAMQYMMQMNTHNSEHGQLSLN